MKIDPYNHKQRYFNWKQKALEESLPGLTKTNSELVLKYIFDMEKGLNISSSNKKGVRSYPRLNNIRQRLTYLIIKLQEAYGLDDITKIKEEQLFTYFTSMRNGEILTEKGKIYKSTPDYIKIFKAFWHWYQKVSKKQGKEIIDITSDLDTSRDKPRWVYLSEEQVKLLADKASYEYRILIMFLFDSGIRAPTELLNIKVRDLHNNCKELSISEEASKTFGRKIKLMICSELLNDFIKNQDLDLALCFP